MNGLAYVGPVKVDWHSQPSFTWDGPKGGDGIRMAKIVGEFEWKTAEQLSELDANEDAKKTVGAHRGVPLIIWTNNAPELAQFHGAYLLESFTLGANVDQSATELPVGTITAAYLGDDLEYVVTRGAFPKGNDFGLTAKSLVVSPVRPADDDGDRFLVDPGGVFGTREYDPTYPYDPAVPTPPDGTARIGIYVGTVTNDADDLESIVYPKVEFGAEVPRWLVDQGGIVRARDRRRQREVYGPHFFHESTDLAVTNGLLHFWVGNRGLTPFLNLQAVVEGARREVGCIQFAGPASAVLRRARLQYVTTELAVVALTIDGYGDALVALRRGEPSLTIVSPSSSIRPTWTGTPPTSRLEQAFVAAGRFDTGLDGTDGVGLPDMRMQWPPTVSAAEFGKDFWWTPAADSDAIGDAGFWTLYEEHGAAIAKVWFESATSTFRFQVGSQTLASVAVAFEAGDELCVGPRFSETGGMSLSVRRPDGSVVHVEDASATVVPAGTPTDFAYLVGIGLAFGEGAFGEGPFGGETIYPEGVVDNDMLFAKHFDDDRFEALAAAETPLDGLGEDEPYLVWYAPFDVDPIVVLDSEADGRIEAAGPDEFGQTRVVAFINSAHTETSVFLALDADLDTPEAQHQQAAAESPQELIRARR